MKTRIGVALWAAGLLLAFSGYGDDSDGVETDPGESPPVPTPGQTVTTWRPSYDETAPHQGATPFGGGG